VADLIAGITVGLLLIPQSLAYAIIANLPPIYGLYTAWVRLTPRSSQERTPTTLAAISPDTSRLAPQISSVIYTVMGTSRQLSIGPEGVVALLTGAAVEMSGSESEYAMRAEVLCLLCVAIQRALSID